MRFAKKYYMFHHALPYIITDNRLICKLVMGCIAIILCNYISLKLYTAVNINLNIYAYIYT